MLPCALCVYHPRTVLHSTLQSPLQHTVCVSHTSTGNSTTHVPLARRSHTAPPWRLPTAWQVPAGRVGARQSPGQDGPAEGRVRGGCHRGGWALCTQLRSACCTAAKPRDPALHGHLRAMRQHQACGTAVRCVGLLGFTPLAISGLTCMFGTTPCHMWLRVGSMCKQVEVCGEEELEALMTAGLASRSVAGACAHPHSSRHQQDPQQV
jgi:hypothetical protein